MVGPPSKVITALETARAENPLPEACVRLTSF